MSDKEANTGIGGERFSNIFLRPKPDGTFRMILNLRKLNESIGAPHFKMESIKNGFCMIEPGAWMASVDLKNAFFTIPLTLIIKSFLNSYIKKSYMNLVVCQIDIQML